MVQKAVPSVGAVARESPHPCERSPGLMLHRWFCSPDGAQVRLVGNLMGVQVVDSEAMGIRQRDAAGILVE